jgi:hypothetical protein
LSGLGPIGESIALLLLNLLIAAVAIGLVSGAARRSRAKGLRAVAAIEPVGASGK